VQVGLADERRVHGPEPGEAGRIAVSGTGDLCQHAGSSGGGSTGHVDEVLDGDSQALAGLVEAQDPGAHLRRRYRP
jgi:hypothetical protein